MLLGSPHRPLPLEQVEQPRAVAGSYPLCLTHAVGKIPRKWLDRGLVEQEAALQTSRKQSLMDRGHFFLLPQAWLLPTLQISSVLLQTHRCLIPAPSSLRFSDLLFCLLTPVSISMLSYGPTVTTFRLAWVVLCHSFWWAACLCPQKKPLLHQFALISCPYAFWCQKVSGKDSKGGHVLFHSSKRLKISRKFHPEKDT